MLTPFKVDPCVESETDCVVPPMETESEPVSAPPPMFRCSLESSALPVMGSVGEDRFTSLTDEITAELEAGDDGKKESANPEETESRRDASSFGPASPPVAKPAQPPVSGPAPRLRLRGFVMMGKVEVTS